MDGICSWSQRWLKQITGSRCIFWLLKRQYPKKAPRSFRASERRQLFTEPVPVDRPGQAMTRSIAPWSDMARDNSGQTLFFHCGQAHLKKQWTSLYMVDVCGCVRSCPIARFDYPMAIFLPPEGLWGSPGSLGNHLLEWPNRI